MHKRGEKKEINANFAICENISMQKKRQIEASHEYLLSAMTYRLPFTPTDRPYVCKSVGQSGPFIKAKRESLAKKAKEYSGRSVV